MLDLDPAREGPAPRDAATLVVVRDGPDALELFCVERNQKSRFLGGAIVFPGGRVEDADLGDAWRGLVNDPDAALRGFGVDACRETLDLRALVPLSRWITPKVENRRFDARFFVARAPTGQRGAHDNSETMASFWASPASILARFEKSEIQLAPPTHRTLMQLAGCKTVEDALLVACSASMEPVCPELVKHGETLALTLQGDPQHSVREARIMGPSRYVLRGAHWRPEPAPGA
jgi:hypothetical protein